MNAGQLAALIAAAFFAIAMCAAVYVLVRFAQLISAATALVTSYQAGADDVLARSRSAVERADEQLARTGAMTDGVDAVAASMSELSVQVSAVASTAKLIASGLNAPVLRLAAAGHGVRHALAVRRSGGPSGIGSRSGGRLRALSDGDDGNAGLARQARNVPAVRAQPRRESWRERTERVRAARDGVADNAARDGARR
ncbi:MAG: hypothetical protein LBV34_23215 [Nocardiopsaceae bacterium]|nr:hypothetical protein [Nocardiopsaceae bacterium]